MVFLLQKRAEFKGTSRCSAWNVVGLARIFEPPEKQEAVREQEKIYLVSDRFFSESIYINLWNFISLWLPIVPILGFPRTDFLYT